MAEEPASMHPFDRLVSAGRKVRAERMGDLTGEELASYWQASQEELAAARSLLDGEREMELGPLIAELGEAGFKFTYGDDDG